MPDAQELPIELDNWLALATRGLCDEARARVHEEYAAHVRDACDALTETGAAAGAALREAVRSLGDPRRARRSLRRVYLTADEDIQLHSLLVSRPVTNLVYDLILYVGIFVLGFYAFTQMVKAFSLSSFPVALLLVLWSISGFFDVLARFNHFVARRLSIRQLPWLLLLRHFSFFIHCLVFAILISELIPVWRWFVILGLGDFLFEVYKVGRLWLKLGRAPRLKEGR